MKRLLTFALLAFAPLASAQNAALMPMPRLTFLDSNGVPLAGGYLYTCVAGTSCTPALPGRPAVNPLATYTDSSAGVANANPIVLDAAGRANVWLGSGTYKIVAQDQFGVTQWSQDNVSSFSLKSVTTSSGAVSNFSVPGTLTAGSIVGPVTYTASVTGAVARTVQTKLDESVSVKDFGAKCDGSTDDSAALQVAFNAGMNSNRTIQIPDGKTCAFATPLTLNIGATGGHLRGGFSQGVGMSKLRYTGVSTSPALTLTYPIAGGGWNLVYNPTIERLQFQCGNAAGCGTALALYNSSEGVFRDVAVEPDFSDLTHKRWATGIYCLLCNINEFDHTTISYATRSGMELVATASTIIHSGDFYENLAHFRISGGTQHTVIEDNWMEMADYGVLFDDSANGILVSGIFIERNRFLMNAGSIEPTWTHQIPVALNNTASQRVQIYKARFEDNTIYIASAQGLASTANIVSIAYSTSPANNSVVDFDIRNNYSQGASAAFAAVTNPFGTANTQLTFGNNSSFDSSGTILPLQVSGASVSTGVQNQSGTLALGPNNTNSGQTVTIANNNGGASSLGIWESSTQAFGAPLQVYNASSQLTAGTNYLGGWFGSAYSLNALASPTAERWNVTTSGTESGSNSGSNYSISRYNDAAGLIDTPFTINRASGQTQVNAIAIPSIKANTGTRFLCIDTSGTVVSQTTACSGT